MEFNIRDVSKFIFYNMLNKYAKYTNIAVADFQIH